ncbi:MAG: glycosyltransferase [Anaerolineae bacterium]|nr:glycosyltransferase [Anaerolineae bacterium]
MPVVAHGIYTYADRFSPFVYDVIANHQRYHPIIFSCGVGVHTVYRQFSVYAPNALDNRGLPTDPKGFRRITRQIGKLFSALGIRQWVLRQLRRRGENSFTEAAHKEQVQLFHAHFGPSAVTFLPLCRQLNLPLIVAFYGYDVTSLPLQDADYRKNLQDVLAYTSFSLAMSHDMRERLIELGCPEHKVVIHHTSVDVNKFAYRVVRENPEPVRILTICNYVEKKGLPYLIQALALVKKHSPRVELRIVGRPHEENNIVREVDRLIRDLSLDDTVVQAGYVPFETLPDEFANADIFALPSVTAADGDQEGIPTVLLEAQACGLPVVSTWHAGIPDAVLDNETGFLVPERDVTQLADRLLQLIKDSRLRERMGRCGRNYVEQEFNIVRQIERLENIYDSISRV